MSNDSHSDYERRRRLRFSPVAVLLAVLYLVPSQHVLAATEYGFTVVSEGSYPSRQSGRIIVDGERWRIDLEGDRATIRAHDSIILTSARRRVALNHTNHTWYQLPNAPFNTDSLFDFHRTYPTRASDIRIESFKKTKTGTEEATFRYRTRTEVGSETIGGAIWGRFVRTVKPDVELRPPFDLLFNLSTGDNKVDALVNSLIFSDPQAIGILELTVNRKLDHGAPMTQTIRWSVTGVRTIPADSTKFDVPAGYAEQPPKIGIPGQG